MGRADLRGALTEVDQRVGDASLNLLSVSIHRGVLPWDEINEGQPVATDFSSYKRVNAGDLILNRMRAFQGAVWLAPTRGMVSPDYAVLGVDTSRAHAGYVSSLFRSEPFLGRLRPLLRGIGSEDSGMVRTPRVAVRDVLRIPVRLPSIAQQQADFVALSLELDGIDGALADAAEANRLSRERRAALISAAVTGKINVTA